jgi:D-beta-D-heptose 7-phosphate kinase / D-beta-D-heptose 1-phosphate adenosyltransferase
MSATHLLVVGDALLDRDVEVSIGGRAPDAPVPVLDETHARVRPGGAALAAALAAAEGDRVTFITALAPDRAGAELARALLDAGVDIVDLGLAGRTAEKIRFLSDGEPLLRLDRGGPIGRVGGDGAIQALRAALTETDAVLVSDYGRGVASHRGVRAALATDRGRVPLVWDPHPRGQAPLPGASLATPNLPEAVRFARRPEPPHGEAELAALATELAAAWRARAVAVTRGDRGALLTEGGATMACPCEHVAGDPCGAGDRFAVAAARSLACGDSCAEAVTAAVAAATDFVGAGGAHSVSLANRRAPAGPMATAAAESTPPPAPLAPALSLAGRVRAGGGTVVATGGCFDLLHAGHVHVLEAAARLGDCLVVLLNSDSSVRRLKGSDRPLIPERERAEMLRALACVDEVAIFDEATPNEVLRLLRPDVWAKGGDYELHQLPEVREVPKWGGRVAILPFLEGQSTTKLIEEVGTRAPR